MKCSALALLAAGAYASQDTSPPVISLTLPAAHGGDDYQDRECATYACTKTTHASKASMKSVTCETGASTTDCPEPTCAAYDHHDGVLHCTHTYTLVNDDGFTTHDVTKDEQVRARNNEGELEATPLNRNLRSEWLIDYSAKDNAGNDADTVSFTMIFRDTHHPRITAKIFGDEDNDVTTDAGSCDASPANTYTKESAGASYLESCSEGGETAPCTHDLGVTATAADLYDENVSDTIKVSLTKPEDDDEIKHVAQSEVDQTTLTKLDLDTQTTGDWTLTYHANDHAGIFGCEESNNNVDWTITLTVEDSIAPIIDITGEWDHTATIECGVDTYVEPGANCKDLRDQWDSTTKQYVTNVLPQEGTTPGTVTGDCSSTRNRLPSDAGENTCGIGDSKVANASGDKTFSVVYACKDAHDNQADPVTRTITVTDTTAPSIWLVGGDATIENSAGDDSSHAAYNAVGDFETKSSGLNFANIGMTCTVNGDGENVCVGGAQCSDKCDKQPTMTAEMFYGADCGESGGASLGDVTNFPEYTAGDYSIKYVCSDNSKNSEDSSVCRHIQNVDHTLPIIQILGSDVMTLEATKAGNYVDDGATCSDQVDGVISQNVEVSGDVVNLSKVGTYEITYNCKDSAGNAAPTAKRTVHVAQTSCPTCVLSGLATQKHEASFDYTDAGAVCTDLIDGKMAPTETKYADSDEAETTAAQMVEQVGTYYITYRAQNSVGLWNDGTCRGTSNTYVRTVIIEDTLKPVIQLKYKTDVVATGDDSDKGLKDEFSHPSEEGNKPSNPAADYFTTTTTAAPAEGLMAEEVTTSVNGWVIGAAASAVTGLALLGYSQRKTTVTSVPV